MYRHILIPTDGSELAERGVTHGLALAKSLGAKVSVIFVVEPFSEMTGRFQEAVATYAELRKEQATSALDRAANAAKEVGISCKTTQVENGQPHQAIIAAAEDKGCDLIVMSSHGRSGLSMLPDRQCDKQGADARENPRTGLSVTVQTARSNAEVNSENWRPRCGPLRGASSSFTRAKAQLGNATVGAAEAPAEFAVDVLHHDHIGVDVGLVVGVEVSGRELVQYRCGLRDDGG